MATQNSENSVAKALNSSMFSANDQAALREFVEDYSFDIPLEDYSGML